MFKSSLTERGTSRNSTTKEVFWHTVSCVLRPVRQCGYKRNTGSLHNLQYLFWTSFLEANIKVANETIKHSILTTRHREGRLEIDVRQTARVHIDFLCPKQERVLSRHCGEGSSSASTSLATSEKATHLFLKWVIFTTCSFISNTRHAKSKYIYTCTLVSLL